MAAPARLCRARLTWGRAAFGAAKLGSGGLGGLLAGKLGLIATVVVVGGAIGTSLYMRMPDASVTSTASFNSNRTPDNYVPAILRNTKDQGSSLDMFKEANKGVLGDGSAASGSADASGKTPAAADTAVEEAKATAPEPGNMAQEMMAKLAGGMGGGLSSTMGSGSQGKFTTGFGNKFKPAEVSKSGFGNMGSGFAASPKFDQRKKLLAMTGSKRPVFSTAKGGKSGPIGKGSLAQMKGLRNMQKSSTGNKADEKRSNQDRAWEGSTPDGSVGGTGVTEGQGGSGIMTSPSLDNTPGGGGGGDTPDPATPPGNPAKTDESPWAGLPEQAMMLIMLSAALSVVGGILCNMKGVPYVIFVVIGIILCLIAMALAVAAIVIGIRLMTQYGQGMMGTIYTIGGGIALIAAVMAITGNMTMSTSCNALWIAAIAAIIAMLGSMAGGK